MNLSKSPNRMLRSILVPFITVVFAMQTLAMTLPLPSPKASLTRTAAAASDADLQSLNQFGRLLVDYSKLYKTLSASAVRRPDDVKRLQDQGNQLKAQVPSAERSYEGLLNTLKSQGVLQDEQKFDKLAEDKINKAVTDGRARLLLLQFVSQNGGASATLRRAPSMISELPAEIDADLKAIASAGKPAAVAFRKPLNPTRPLYMYAVHPKKCVASCILALGGALFSETGAGVAVCAVGLAGMVENCFDD